MMHAGVLMKLGAYGVLRVGFQLLPDAAQEWAWLVGTVAVINIVYGAMAAAWQTDIKYLIAYSSVSQMGIVMLGMATLTEAGVAGSVFQMVAHGIMTALLFTLVKLGFVLLTVSLLSGFLFVNDLFAQHLAHKTVFSMAAWVVFGVLIVKVVPTPSS